MQEQYRLSKAYFGKYRGIVTENNDPEKRGRIKARVPELFGDVETNWCEPAQFFQGAMFIPKTGDYVWVEFEAGNPNLPIYSACWFPKLPTEAEKNYPDKQVIQASSGFISFDDKDKEVLVRHSLGYRIQIKDDQMELISPSGGKIKMDKLGNIEIDFKGQVKVSGATIEISGATVKISGTSISLGI